MQSMIPVGFLAGTLVFPEICLFHDAVFPPLLILPRILTAFGDLRMSPARAVAVQPVHKSDYCLAATRDMTLVGFNGCGWKAVRRLQIPILFPL